MSDERRQYIQYVQNILGVKSLVLDSVPTARLGVQSHVPLLVMVENLHSYSEAETDLLKKMVGALKIETHLVEVVDASDMSRYRADMYLQLSDSGQPLQEVAEGAPVVTTYSARTLLQNTSLKKTTWAELQKIISHFSKRP